MKINNLVILPLVFLALSCNSPQNEKIDDQMDPIKLLVVTGGPTLRHQIDLVPTSFYSHFSEQKNIRWVHATFDESAFQTDDLMDYDAILLYNRHDTLSEESQQNFKNFLESGKGLIVLHHSLGNYNDWEWYWKEVAAGKYQMKANEDFPKSDYKLGESIKMRKTKSHPISDAVGDFDFVDETYKDLWISPDADILYTIDNPLSDGPTVWISPYEKSRVIVIQPGHDDTAHLDKNFKKLILESLKWVTGG